MTHLTAVHTDLSPLPWFSYAARAMAMRDTLCLVWTKDNDIQTKSVGGCRCQCCLGKAPKKNRFFLGNSPKQWTPPTHTYGLGLT